nr:hypothetical protein B0A51_17079 [Rachicladosporium sp. CCFEE 5018]
MSSTDASAATNEPAESTKSKTSLRYVSYGPEKESPYLPAIRQLISQDLSEPYSIYVYRYFLYQWGELCFMTLDDQERLVGVIVCKLEPHRGGPMRGYIAMLATRKEHRGQGIATKLVKMAIDKMIVEEADEVVLETEVDNIPSLRIYENLGFIRTKRLHRYYLNGNTAFRLILYLKPGVPSIPTFPPDYGPPEGAEHGNGLMDEDLITRQTAHLQLEDAQHERFDVTGRSSA